MSEELKGEPTSPAPKKAEKEKKPGRWRRRVIWGLSIFVVLLALFRLALSVLLPVVMNRVARTFDLSASYDRLDLSLLGGSAAIWNFQLLPSDGKDPILQADYCEGDISVLDLLRGRLVIYRAAADGVSATIERTVDGKIPLLARFAKLTTGTSKPAPVTAGPIQLSDISLTPPLRLDALRLEHILARVDDQFVRPPLDARLALDLRISDLGSPGKPLKFELVFNSDPVLESLDVHGTSTGDDKSQTAEFDVSMRGLHLKPAEGYLRQIGLKPIADSIYASMSGTLKATVSPSDPKSVAADLELKNSSITVDGKPAASLDLFALKAEALNTRSAHISKLLVQGVKAEASRGVDGSLQGFGVALAPAIPTANPVPATDLAGSNVSGTAAPATTSPAPFPFHFRVDEFALEGFHAGFSDLAVSPAVNLALDLTEFKLTNLAYDPDHGPVPINLTALLSSPGMVRAINVQGLVSPTSSGAIFTMQAKADGIEPAAVKPYLDAIGLASDWKEGTFGATVDGAISAGADGVYSASAKLSNINLSNGSRLLGFDEMSAKNASFDPSAQKLRVDEIVVDGPELAASRDASGSLHVLGFHTKPAVSTSVIEPEMAPNANAGATEAAATTSPSSEAIALGEESATTEPAVSAAPAIPGIEIGHFVWRGVHVDLKDEGSSPPTAISITDAGIDVRDLLFDLGPGAKGHPGTIHGWLTSPELARSLTLDGTLASSARKAELAFEVKGLGIRGDSIATYLQPLGIKPTVKDGSLSLHGDVMVRQTDGGFGASVSCENLDYRDGDSEFFSLKSARVGEVAIEPEKLTVDKIEIASPEIWANRLADGSLSLMGIDVGGPTAPPPAVRAGAGAPTEAAPTPSTVAAPPVMVAQTPEASGPRAAPSLPMVVALNAFALHGAMLHWKDAAVAGGETTDASLDASLNKLVIGPGALPADVHFAAKIDQSLDSVSGDGTLDITPARQSIQMDVKGNGLRAGPLAVYFPPGAELQLMHGAFGADFKASAAFNPRGGEAVELGVNHLDYRDAGQNDAFLKMDSFYVLASRIDPPAKVVTIDDISLNGFETQAHKTKRGVSLLGLEVGPAGAGAAPAGNVSTGAPAAQSPAADSATPENAAASTVQAAPAGAPGANAIDLVRAQRGKFPLVVLKNLDLNLAQLTLIDDTTPARSPVWVRNVRLHNTAPIAWLGPDPEANPPTQLQLSGRVDPLFDAFKIDIQALPFSKSKSVNTEVLVDAIHGDGIVAVLPEVKDLVDGSGLKAGRFESESELTAKLRNVGPADFGLEHGGKIDFSVKNVAFRIDPKQDPVAGVGEISSEGIIVGPNVKSVEVKELEVDNLLGRAMRDKDGIHALGLLVKLPVKTATTQPVMASAAPVDRAMDQSSAAAPLAGAMTKPAGEYKIDSLVVSGCDFNLEDRTSVPPLVVPINSLDVTAKNLSNMLPFEPEACTFNVLVNAGKSPMLGSRSSEIGKLEERDLFSQVTAAGKVSAYPKLNGWTKASVSGFELASLHGLAAQNNVTLNGGTFDTDIDLRFPGDGSIDTSTKLVVTDLGLTEEPNGPISKFLKLPAPLDVVLGVVQDADGSITLPINFPIKDGQVGMTEVAASAVGAVGSVVANAIAAAPLKAVDALGLGGKESPVQPVTLVFPPGYASVTTDQMAELQGLIKKIADDDSLQATLRHDVGSEDISLAGDRVNPTPRDALNLASRLKERRDELLAARTQAAGDLRSLLASGASDEAQGALERLRRIDRALAETENAMDKAYELLRPGADRQKDRRTRAAVLSVARARLDAVRDAIVSVDEKHLDGRVLVTNPQISAEPGAVESSVTITVVKKK